MNFSRLSGGKLPSKTINLLYNCLTTMPATTAAAISANVPGNNLELLKNRALIKLDGPDAGGLLQGLITNDIYQMPEGTSKLSSLYAMFLNAKGRIICDSLIYALGETNSYVVEADASIIGQLLKHLKIYKLRKEVDIKLLDSYKVYALYNTNEAVLKTSKGLIPNIQETVQETASCVTNGTLFNDMFLFRDPRVTALGYRVLAKKLDTFRSGLCVDKVDPSDGKDFRWLRYNLGVGEGVIDIPPQKCFPLEHNCDYMNGLNLHKGCYLGQELTARTYHTGKIRKRLMPLILKQRVDQVSEEVALLDETKQNLGKLRGVRLDAGLALLRMHLVLDVEFPVAGTQATTRIPHWWPGFKTVVDEIQQKNNTQ